jgi:hypothetical protein
MSGQLASIPEAATFYGPLLSSIEEAKFRRKCKLLSRLPLPVHLIAPEHLYTEENMYKGLCLLGKDIEKHLLELKAESIKSNIHIYVFCVNINCEVVSQVNEELSNCLYSWNLFTFNLQYDHGWSILDLLGNPFLSLSRLIGTTKNHNLI